MFTFKVSQKFMSDVSRKAKMPIFFTDTGINYSRGSLGDTPTTNTSLIPTRLPEIRADFKNFKNSIVSNFYSIVSNFYCKY